MNRACTILIWGALAIAVLVPLIAATASPLLAWRDGVYIAAGLAGVIAMVLLLVQPLLVGDLLPGVPAPRGRRIHGILGSLLALAVAVHVAGLWITSPPDVIDALQFAATTPFSFWGVVAMWAVFATVLLAALRRRLPLRVHIWRRGHASLAIVIVLGSVVHALLIEGTIETVSKAGLCALVIAATITVLARRRVLAKRKKPL